MLIDANGLMYGERICACSDEAQLHFPRLLAASNGFGRIQMSYATLTATVYAGMRTKPTKDQVTRMFREYHANFLLFVYQAKDGTVWGQWDIPSKLLPRHKTARDMASPAPVTAEFEGFRASYVEAKRMQYQDGDDQIAISEGFGNVPKSSEGLQTGAEELGMIPRGIGIGVGEGVGEVLAPAPPSPNQSRQTPDQESDPRHVPFREGVHEHYRTCVPGKKQAPWNGSEAKALAELLRSNPDLTLEQFILCLANRAQSRVQLSDRPRRWLETVTDYLSGPKDEYGKPLKPKIREPGTVSKAVPNAKETAARSKQEREEALTFWREARDDGRPVFETAPAWAKQALAAEAVGCG